MKQTKSVAGERRRRRLFTFLWSGVIAVATIALIYWELTAILYILATLGVSALLVVVALADLRKGDKGLTDSQGVNDSAALGSGITSTFGADPS